MLNPAQNLLEILVKNKVLTSAQVDEIKLQSANTGKSIEEVIEEKQLVTAVNMAKSKAELFNVPYVDLSDVAVVPMAISLVPQVVAQRYKVVPIAFSKETNELSLAMANPLDLEAVEFIEKKAGTKIKVFISDLESVEEAVNRVYSQSLTAEVKAALGESAPDIAQPNSVDITQLGKVIREAPIAKIVSTVLEYAMKARASDIHIEPAEDKTRVRYRIDGILHEKLILPRKVHESVISRIKILGGMRIDEKRIPQDGRFNFRAGDQEVDLRVSSLPTVFGEKIVMRLLKKSGGVPDLPDLGLRGRALKNLEDSILRPHGIIIVCGPTGSGKTTTLYSVLTRISTPKVNVVTLEDPVEYQMPGVNQVQINPGAGLTFASGLRSFLRQDPNIIMVGEIRDKETTELAVQAALTGHLVFSTLHTNDASGALPRLLDLGAEPFLLASSMTCIVAQRVCRRVCPDCKEQYAPPSEVAQDIKTVLGKLYDDKEIKLTRGKKCATCNNTGYLGRIGMYEVLPVSEKVARLILERSSGFEIEKIAVEEGMIKMKQDGYLKALEGLTTLEEVLRVAQE